MKNTILFIALIVLIPVSANLYFFIKLGTLYSELEKQDVAGSYRKFAVRVESGELTNKEIASRLNRMAGGEEKVTLGLSQLRFGVYFWLVSVFLIALLQGMLIYKLVKSHNKAMQHKLLGG